MDNCAEYAGVGSRSRMFLAQWSRSRLKKKEKKPGAGAAPEKS